MKLQERIFLRSRTEKYTEVHKWRVNTFAYRIREYRTLKLFPNYFESFPWRRPDLMPHQKRLVKMGWSVDLAQDCIVDISNDIYAMARFKIGRGLVKALEKAMLCGEPYNNEENENAKTECNRGHNDDRGIDGTDAISM